ncbi:MAG: GGDEF domain-containing protein [Anaerovoracaceae bacterium]
MIDKDNSDKKRPQKPSKQDEMEQVRYTPVPHLKTENIVLIIVPIVMLLAFTLTLHLVAARMAHVSYDSDMVQRKEAIRVTVQNIKVSLNAQEKNITSMHKSVTKDGVRERLTNYLRNTLHSSAYDNEVTVDIAELVDEKKHDGKTIRVVADSKDESIEDRYFSVRDIEDHCDFPLKNELSELRDDGDSSGEYFENGGKVKHIYYSCFYDEYDWIIMISKEVPTKHSYTHDYMMTMLPPVMLVSFIIVISAALIIQIMLKRIHRHDYITYRNRNESLQELVDEDALTHAGSRRKGDTLLQEEFERQRILDKYDTAVMMIDMDFFKGINDKYGHDAGDHVLQEMVKAIRSVARSADDIIRWGGDEFIGIFRGMTEENLPVMEQHIVDAINDIEIYTGGEMIHVSASIGSSFFQKDDRSCYDVVKRADRALYSYKRETHGNDDTR